MIASVVVDPTATLPMPNVPVSVGLDFSGFLIFMMFGTAIYFAFRKFKQLKR